MTELITNEWLTKSQAEEMISTTDLKNLDSLNCEFSDDFQNEVDFESKIVSGDFLIKKRYTLFNYSSYDDLPEELSDVDWDSAKIEYWIETI